MKTVKLLLGALTMGMLLVSCGSSEPKSKMLPASSVTINGKHSDFLEVADSVKIMLKQVNEEKDTWYVCATVPMKNTKKWSEFPENEQNKKEGSYYEPEMGNLTFEYTDADGVTLDLDLGTPWSSIEEILDTDEPKTVNLMISAPYSWSAEDYSEMLAIYEKVAGIAVSRAELSEVIRVADSKDDSDSGYSSNSDYSSSYSRAAKEVADAYQDAAKEVADAYEAAAGAYGAALEAASSYYY